jgi:hypothetical protein
MKGVTRLRACPFLIFAIPPPRLERGLLPPEGSALSTELWGLSRYDFTMFAIWLKSGDTLQSAVLRLLSSGSDLLFSIGASCQRLALAEPGIDLLASYYQQGYFLRPFKLQS